MLTLKGTSEYSNTTYANKLTIKADRISFSNKDYDGIHAHKMMLDTSKATYETGVDNSGGKYERIRIYSGNWYYSIASSTMNQFQEEYISIQTWDRKEIFVHAVYKHKGTGKGKNWRPDSSDTESAIILLDEQSAKLLAEYIDQIRSKS